MSRYKLNWYEFERKDSGDCRAKLPLCDVYSSIIDRAFPNLDHRGWRPDNKGTCWTYIRNPSSDEEKRLRDFLEFLRTALVLRPNKNLECKFSDELDECFAIDYNLDDTNTYTGAGKLEYEAKYNKDPECAEKLAEILAAICRVHPSFERVGFIAAVPGNPGKDFHLPDVLVSLLGKVLGRPTGLSLTKTKATPQLKTLSVDEKSLALEGAFTLSDDVGGRTVLLVDDLYQSGTTMWTIARFLKGKGAAAVYGLACVKSWRDSDNV